MTEIVHVIVLAGGSGARLWPLSRQDNPKYLGDFGHGRTLLAETLRRATAITDRTRITIVTGRHHASRVRTVAHSEGISSILVEPRPRGTAAAIAAATRLAGARDGSAVVVVLPADHDVGDLRAWTDSVGEAVATAERGGLVCLGVRPLAPLTAFGYINAPDASSPDAPRAALAFVEKPDAARATAFLHDGGYFWNTGISVWRCDSFAGLMRLHAPAVQHAVEAATTPGTDVLDAVEWPRAPYAAIESVLLEPAAAQGAVTLVPARFTWADLGSWDVVASRGIAVSTRPRVHELDAHNCHVIDLVRQVGRRYALLGVDDLILVDSGDVLLITHRNRAQDVRKLVEELRTRGWEDLL